MITDLASFRVALADYINRTDAAPALLDQFIDNGRRQAARYVSREQELVANVTLNAELRAALPDRFMAMRAVYTVEGITLPQMSSVFASVGAEGGYRVRMTEIEAFGGELVEGDELELQYYEYPSALVGDGDTNSFLLANADLWLWAAVQEAARYYRNIELLDTANSTVADLGTRVEATAKAGRQYGGPRQMRVRGG